MQVNEDALRERYSSMETEALRKLNRTSDLTPVATAVLRDVLAERGFTLEARDRTTNPYEQPKSNLIRPEHRFSLQTLFRTLVVGNSVLFAFWFFFYPYLEAPFLSAETLDMLAMAGYGSKIPFEYWLSYFFAFVWLAVFVGLYRFRPWARSGLLWLFVLGVLTGPFRGLNVDTSVSGTISWVMTTVDGVIVALCYFSAVAARFSAAVKLRDEGSLE